jgi:hypothetical protein
MNNIKKVTAQSTPTKNYSEAKIKEPAAPTTSNTQDSLSDNRTYTKNGIRCEMRATGQPPLKNLTRRR